MFESAPNKVERTHPHRIENLMVGIGVGAWGDSQVGVATCVCMC